MWAYPFFVWAGIASSFWLGCVLCFMCCTVKPPALAGEYKALLFYHFSSRM